MNHATPLSSPPYKSPRLTTRLAHNSAQQSLARPWILDAAGLACLLAIALAAYLLILRPILHHAQLRDHLEGQLAAEILQSQHLRQALLDAHAAVDLARAQADASEITLLPITHLNATLATLAELALHHNLALDVIAPSEPAYYTHYGHVPIRLEGRGSFPDVTAFLAALHRGRVDVAVSAFTLAAHPNAGTPTFRLELAWSIAQPSKS